MVFLQERERERERERWGYVADVLEVCLFRCSGSIHLMIVQCSINCYTCEKWWYIVPTKSCIQMLHVRV